MIRPGWEFEPAAGDVEDAGFTLTEVLVTLTIFSLVMLVTSAGLQRGAAAWSRTQSVMSAIEEIAIAERVLSGFSERAYALNTFPDLIDQVSSPGMTQAVSFVYYTPSYPDQPGYALIELLVVEKEEGQNLVMRQTRVDRGSQVSMPDITVKESALILAATNIEIAYLLSLPASGSSEWRTSWEDEARLPEILRFIIETRGKSHEFVVRLGNALPPECKVQRRGERCKWSG